MSWRHNSQPSPGALPPRLSDDQPLLIHRRRRQYRPGSRNGTLQADIAGVLDTDLVTRFKQGAGHQIHRLLRAGGNQDPVRRRGDASGGAQIFRDRNPQRQISLRILIPQKLRRLGPPKLARQSRPSLERKGIDGRVTGIEKQRPGSRIMERQRAHRSGASRRFRQRRLRDELRLWLNARRRRHHHG